MDVQAEPTWEDRGKDAVKVLCIVLVNDMVQCCPTLLPNQLAAVFLAYLFAQKPYRQQRHAS
jgi:hypothetical protein